ncbi:MAG: UDP-N-acetylmuramate dehydrogenase [Planctomycetes bacterium]|nr:UDP-N-acetylmuramate dehydrogenase [Planctomycetota bacterium]
MDLSEIITENEPLARHTYFRIGGPAKFFVQPRTEGELAAVLGTFAEEGEDIHILGGGTNLLISDDGIGGAVIRLGKEFAFCEFTEGSTRAVVGAGHTLASVVRQSVERGLAGLEGVIGVPGTFGGAAFMNAGGKHGNVGDVITSATVMGFDGTARRVERDEIEFSYRSSSIDGILLQAELEFERGDAEELSVRMKDVLQQKRDSQPLSAKSAGCAFKNPPGQSAGALIDQLGFKGVSVGGAQVSEKHANFIVNTGDATAAHVLELIDIIREKVKLEFDVDLDLEVRLWGFG